MIETISLTEESDCPTNGTGWTHELPDGTWEALVVVDNSFEDPYCIIGRGESEGVALRALEAKLSAFGKMSAAAFVQAEAGYRRRKAEDDKRSLEAFKRLIGADDGFAPLKKKEEN